MPIQFNWRLILWTIALAVAFFGGLPIAKGVGAFQNGGIVSVASPITLRVGTLLDGRGGVLKDVSIRIEGSRIISIGRSSEKPTFNLASATVMPGLIDTHVHFTSHFNKNGRADSTGETPGEQTLYAAENAWLTLQAGFTTAQNLGAAVDLELRSAIDRGVLPGPRVLTSVRQIGRTSEGLTAEQLRETVRRTKAEGADVIKLFASGSIREGSRQIMTAEEIRAVCDEATAQGMRSVVHAYSAQAMKDATLAGCTAIEHGAFGTDEVFALMAARGTYYDPHIGLLLQNYLDNRQKFFGIGNFTEEGFLIMQESIPKAVEAFKRALRTPRLKIVFGTDANAGAHGRNVEESVARVQQGGQSARDALISMTSLAAESLRMQDRIGTLMPGMEADIVAVRGNPLTDIKALRHVIFVMKGGKVFKNEP